MCPPISLPLRNARFLAATHIGYSPQARHKVNCPKGKRGSPEGIPVPRNSFTRCYRQFLWVALSNKLYRRVRQGELPEGQEKVPWGTTSAHHSSERHKLHRRGVPSAATPLSQTKMQRQEKQFFLPLLCPVKRYLLYHLWFAVYRNE